MALPVVAGRRSDDERRVTDVWRVIFDAHGADLACCLIEDVDLVEVAPTARPPVCRIMDYGKFKYETSQRAKESRKKASSVSLKEMKYRPKIGQGDFNTKTAKVEKFLSDGHKVKITIMFRGREVFHPELGREILERVAENVETVGKVDQFPKLDGRNMTMVLSPDRAAKQRRKDAEVGPGE